MEEEIRKHLFVWCNAICSELAEKREKAILELVLHYKNEILSNEATVALDEERIEDYKKEEKYLECVDLNIDIHKAKENLEKLYPEFEKLLGLVDTLFEIY